MRGLLTSRYLVAVLAAACFAVCAPLIPGMATSGNLSNLVWNMLPLAVVTIGEVFVLIAGGIDLSVTAIIALCSVTGALVMNGRTGYLAGNPAAAPVAVLFMLLVGALLGFLNGCAVTRLRMPAFIVTLTTMMFFGGFAVWLTRSANIDALPPAFNGLAGFGTLTVAVVVALAAHRTLRHSIFGRWLYATGMNARASLVSGVPVHAVTIAAYSVSGLLAAAASVLYTARLETGSPVLGQRIFLDVIAAAVIGGTSLFGGRGTVAGTLAGVLFVALLDNSLNLLGVSFFLVFTAKGVVILVAALLDSAAQRVLGEAVE
ncbi:MAG: ABC transporter permease [Candidatus Solibacter sp.]|nr:ABC transporter permease [Candidatus Solibacter sp.]